MAIEGTVESMDLSTAMEMRDALLIAGIKHYVQNKLKSERAKTDFDECGDVELRRLFQKSYDGWKRNLKTLYGEDVASDIVEKARPSSFQ